MHVHMIGLMAVLLAIAAPAEATPGVGDPVYGATVTKGLAEYEARFGRLTGGTASGEDGLVLEGEYGVTPRLALAVLVETGRTFGGPREANAIALEAIRSLGRHGGIDTAVYFEIKHGLGSTPDAVEVKGLFERVRGRFDARLNLIAEKPLREAPVEFGYAASADWAVIGDEIRLGATAFGDLGTSARFGGRQAHFVGPTVKAGIEHVGHGEIEIEAGWLKAIGAARDSAQGQARLLVSYEVRF